ncbi:MAG: NAD(P)/FAD-dependent oxidoreductase [Alphaproteobacteria bacterium]|nr:NAD(P)/FAD-dependent oxidoreductase [Alphaproteobacteria bacterium]
MDTHTNAHTETSTDVAIIGAGPVGLFSVFECGMLGFRSTVIDVLDTAGGQCAALYPEKPIYDIPGYPTVMAMELIDRLLEQAAPFKPVYRLGHPVLRMTPIRPRGTTNDGWRLEIAGGHAVEARAVIIAGGTGAFGPVRLPLAGVERFEGKSVFYVVRRKADLAGKRVVIAGGGDSAVDWALALAGIAAKMWVVHRRDKFRAAPESVRKMHELAASGALEMVIPYQLAGLEGQGGHLSAVKVATLDGEERTLDADVVLAFFGLVNNLGPIAEWGITLDQQKHIFVNPATCATNLPRVFAVGDIAAYPGKLKLILSGFAEAAQAAHAIHPILHPDKALHFEYSTSKGVPGK